MQVELVTKFAPLSFKAMHLLNLKEQVDQRL